MKKTNFVVVFWLLLTLISFVVFLINFYSLWDSIGLIFFPSDSEWQDGNYLYRTFFTAIPMLIVTAASFYLGLKQGLKVYNQN